MFQLVAFLDSGDAIGEHARCLAGVLGEAHGGFIVERAAPECAGEAVHYRDAKVRPEDVLIYHVAHGSPLAAWLRDVRAVKVIDYHGITPPSFVRGWDPGLAVALDRARGELGSLTGEVSLAIAHSAYTCRELDAAGFPRTATVPVLIDQARLATPPNPALLAGLAAGKRSRDLLFVSRLAPNKRIEDLLKVFAIYRRAWCPAARLFLVGRPDTGTYDRALRSFADRLGVEEVHFTGKLPVADLMAHYRNADLFLSMSGHEGFGIPWIEAMAFGVPVVSYAAGAIPETVGDAGVVFGDLRYDEVAALVDLVLGDEALQARLVAAGTARAEHFRPEHSAGGLRALIDGVGHRP